MDTRGLLRRDRAPVDALRTGMSWSEAAADDRCKLGRFNAGWTANFND